MEGFRKKKKARYSPKKTIYGREVTPEGYEGRVTAKVPVKRATIKKPMVTYGKRTGGRQLVSRAGDTGTDTYRKVPSAGAARKSTARQAAKPVAKTRGGGTTRRKAS